MWGGSTGGNQTVILREKVSRQEILQANMLELQMSFLVMPSSHQEIQDGRYCKSTILNTLVLLEVSAALSVVNLRRVTRTAIRAKCEECDNGADLM